ncbi:MAG: hypothetical protein HQM08_09700 [Candidatus Riflebacteria bacterium]|nr:hypothetical protein [Candidatus Riflebacteria bacterium]
MAPELSTLIALDASLLATISILEFQNPFPINSDTGNWDISEVAEDHIVCSICTLAKALRKNLAAFYSLIQMDLERRTETNQEVEF